MEVEVVMRDYEIILSTEPTWDKDALKSPSLAVVMLQRSDE